MTDLGLILLFTIHSFVVYRVARFIALDVLIDGTRNRLTMWLSAPALTKNGLPRQRLEFVKDKLWHLIKCPFCITPYVSAGVIAGQALFSTAVPVPFWWWLGLSGASLLWWAIIEDEDES